ncbi:hypothetical protein P3T65_07105 [Pseudomonas nitroreducens]|uniref:hypothetical protein n=1 Tax=Pseudomonas TaxID=286 RepID=UPI001CF0AEE6|nr:MULTISPECIES: hypothetical protein [Pseudomonas]UCL87372.1 hypothetical protein LDJ84_01320 [Pseudomonas sp. HS-18]WEW99477.1 hypothetical protein P3T65_07105 [Pseudomonas nitroreducens]
MPKLNLRRQAGVARRCLVISLFGIACLALALGMLWKHARSTSAIDGRYASSGQVLLGSGKVLEIAQTTMFHEGRFYSMIQQDANILEVSGNVGSDLGGRYQLQVEENSISNLQADSGLDSELIFNLLYGRQRGARITLEPLGECLYGVETRQVFCPRHPRDR